MKKLFSTILLLGLWLIPTLANAVYIPSRTPCSETDYKQPCNCLKESSWTKKRFCNFRAGIKKGDYVTKCADRSDGYSDAIAKEVYKDCMHDHGF